MRRYLIVDDNPAFAENLAEILADAGAHADVATGGAAALERARATRYDALISDMRMPLMGGAELVHRVRRLDPGLPAVVVTAYTHDDDLHAARREGLLAVLPKPAPVGRLLEIIASARRDGIVAVIEDDPSMSDNLCEVLRSAGFTAVTAASLIETERLGGVRPFVALVDLRLPGGADGAAMTRFAERFPGVPMLVISGHDLTPPVPHLGYFHKPFHTADVLAAVERLYAERHG
ncbi:MAG TPA: response regulator [Haliangiales bacterium]|nr:response regulator [Haliangiales bacterium]